MLTVYCLSRKWRALIGMRMTPAYELANNFELNIVRKRYRTLRQNGILDVVARSIVYDLICTHGHAVSVMNNVCQEGIDE